MLCPGVRPARWSSGYLRYGGAKDQKQKPDQKIAAFGGSYSWIGYHFKNRSAVRPPSRAGSLPQKQKQKQSSAAARGEAAPLNNERKLECS